MKSRIILALAIATCLTACSDKQDQANKSAPPSVGDAAPLRVEPAVPIRETRSGDFLDGHFAQSMFDWDGASRYLDRILLGSAASPDNAELLKRAMILDVGSGHLAQAASRAGAVLRTDPHESLALLVLAVSALAGHRDDQASQYLKAMPDGDLTAFIKPLLTGWIAAGHGQLETANLNHTSIHTYHAALMALLARQPDQARIFARRMLAAGGLNRYDAERAGDLLALLGQRDDALAVYQGVQAQAGSDPQLVRKIAALRKNDGSIDALLSHVRIATPTQGAALAMYDMALVLFQEDSDATAKIFAQMGLDLDPAMTGAKILLAEIMARNGQADQAIEFFKAVPSGDPAYQESQRRAADLLADAHRQDEAMRILNALYTNNGNVEALIRAGDLYRENEDYAAALRTYTLAIDHFGDRLPDAYWYLLYARGMTYERMGDWDKAQADLQAALAHQPDNAYLLNYLGYGWADKGQHLDRALAMIKKAVMLKPEDGYITDSLGWVYYRTGNYREAIPHLERAVELLPYDTTINDHLGDAYWRAGREDEARFQWQRAFNYAGPKDDKEKAELERKLKDGLPPPASAKN